MISGRPQVSGHKRSGETTVVCVRIADLFIAGDSYLALSCPSNSHCFNIPHLDGRLHPGAAAGYKAYDGIRTRMSGNLIFPS